MLETTSLIWNHFCCLIFVFMILTKKLVPHKIAVWKTDFPSVSFNSIVVRCFFILYFSHLFFLHILGWIFLVGFGKKSVAFVSCFVMSCQSYPVIFCARDDVFSYKFCSCSEPQNPGRYTVVKGSMAVATPNFGGDLFSGP